MTTWIIIGIVAFIALAFFVITVIWETKYYKLLEEFQKTSSDLETAKGKWKRAERMCHKFARLIAEGPNEGINFIRKERVKQLTKKNFTPNHDLQYTKGQLAKAAMAYIIASHKGAAGLALSFWPFAPERFKPHSPMRNYQIAGAFLAADIDRILLDAQISVEKMHEELQATVDVAIVMENHDGPKDPTDGMLYDGGVMFTQAQLGTNWICTGPGFVDLQVSPAGFGANKDAAYEAYKAAVSADHAAMQKDFVGTLNAAADRKVGEPQYQNLEEVLADSDKENAATVAANPAAYDTSKLPPDVSPEEDVNGTDAYYGANANASPVIGGALNTAGPTITGSEAIAGNP